VAETPLARKLVVHAGDTLLLLDRPDGWSVPQLPPDVSSVTESLGTGGGAADVIIAFFRSLGAAREAIPSLAPRIFPAGAIWAAWPRRAGGHQSDITERDIRAIALALGLVDVKVAALDEDWSGLRLVWRRERR